MAVNIYPSSHPLTLHKLTLLRRNATEPKKFRELVSELSMMMAYEATQDLPMLPIEVETPLTTTRGKSRLLQEEQQVLEELKHLRDAMLAEVDIDPEEGDAEITEREKNAALLNVLENKLQDIQAALRSIEKGSYGTCARCGDPIEPGRLEVKPDATHCLKCQSEVERLSRRGRTARQINW